MARAVRSQRDMASDVESGAPSRSKPSARAQLRSAWLLALACFLTLLLLVLVPLHRRYDLRLMALPPSAKRLALSPADAEAMAQRHIFLFIGGPHRGGTTLLWRLLRLHPQVGGFSEWTDSDFGEGAFIQSVLPTFGVGGETSRCRRIGGSSVRPSGVGQYALDHASHLTEGSRLATKHSRDTLLAEWGFYWRQTGALERPVLIEKTPTNLMTARLLQSLFAPRVAFLFVTRHPLAVALAERRLTTCRGEASEAVLHWALSHTVLQRDLPRLSSARVLRYEDLAASPTECLTQVSEWLAAPSTAGGGGVLLKEDANAEWHRLVLAEEVDPSTNRKYERQYCARELEGEAQRHAHCVMATAFQPMVDALGLGYDVMRGGRIGGFECVGERVSCSPDEASITAEADALRERLRTVLEGYAERVDAHDANLQLGGDHLLCAEGTRSKSNRVRRAKHT